MGVGEGFKCFLGRCIPNYAFTGYSKGDGVAVGEKNISACQTSGSWDLHPSLSPPVLGKILLTPGIWKHGGRTGNVFPQAYQAQAALEFALVTCKSNIEVIIIIK